MSRYLNEEQLKSYLSYGKSVEQWLGYSEKDDYIVLKWIRIDKKKNEDYSIAYFEAFDEGDIDFFDIYDFSLIDPDEPYGIINSFESMTEVLDFAKDTYGASPDKFVTEGLLQEEYRAYLNSRKA